MESWDDDGGESGSSSHTSTQLEVSTEEVTP